MNPAIPVERLIASPAKVLASALWVSGRERDEAMRNSVFYAMPQALRELIDVSIDEHRREVSLSITLDDERVPRLIEVYRRMYPAFGADWDREARRLLGQGKVTRTAVFTGDQGCVILPLDGSGLQFEPVTVQSALPDADATDWPLGDRLPQRSSPLDPARLSAALDAAFADPQSCTAAFLAVYRGEIVAERYAPGFDHRTQLESWSMGKSVTATLIGLLIQQALLDFDEPAHVPAWRVPGDPRGAIRVRDLMRMSSGLRFSGTADPRERWEHGVPDHTLVYADAINVFEFSTSRPVEFPPNTVGRYRNCDPLTLGYIVKRLVTERLSEKYLTWPQRALFDRIGIRRQVMETDRFGQFIMTGYDYGTARNWARLGMLYLNDGTWAGERLLPEGFARFVATPAPAWEQPEYGAQFWVNGTGKYNLPRDACYMGGAGEQRTFVVPSHDLVVVRMGHRRGADRAPASLNEALKLVVEAIEVARAGGHG